MIDLSVTTEINAPAETIWQTLIDLPRFREWNPFIRAASGTPAVGAKLRVRVRPSLALPLVFRPTVLACDANRELRWRGHFLTRWLASGEHTFALEPAGEGRTRLVQREVFTGLLPPLVSGLLAREARRGFDAMNQALKARVEHAGPGVAATPPGGAKTAGGGTAAATQAPAAGATPRAS
jgi:hypothetical protein